MPQTFRFQDPPVLSFSPKRLSESLVYGFDFVNLLNSGEAIASSLWYIVPIRPAGIVIATTGMLVGGATNNTTQTFQKIDSGTEGVTYNVVAQITTTFGNVMEQGALLITSNDPFE